MTAITDSLAQILSQLNLLAVDEKIEAINFIREKIHEISPFKNEPVDFVRWVKNEAVVANDYNPNKVAPPEMQLLEVSILNDGYTQPIVTAPKDSISEVVDGFHRSRVGKESIVIKQRVMGYLPIVSIRSENEGKANRIASTIRHNRARGKHQVSAMSEIVIELKNRNWANERIARELGMDEDEILRLCQVAGLEDLFKDGDFSKAWESADYTDAEYVGVDDMVSDDEMEMYKIPNEKDETRIFHTWDKWEAVKYNFFGTKHPTLSNTQCEYKYLEVLSDVSRFDGILTKVVNEWPFSCEHNLTNKSMNRVAWLGQAAVAYEYNVPSIFSSGFALLTEEEQYAANEVALRHLNQWLSNNGLEELSMQEAVQQNRQVELY